jgi:hypothetical protein
LVKINSLTKKIREEYQSESNIHIAYRRNVSV